MSGWIYLIRNGDLYKIGITKNIINRMRQLKPDEVLVKSYVSNYKELEKQLHYSYKKVRIPQTEYFRLNISNVRSCKRIILFNNNFNYFSLRIFLRLFLYIFIIFSIFIILNFLIFYNLRIVISNSLYLTEKVSFLFMFISFLIKSGVRLDFLNECGFRIQRAIIYLIFTVLLNFISQLLQYYFPA